MKKQIFDIVGMSCSACSAKVEKSVKKISGIIDESTFTGESVPKEKNDGNEVIGATIWYKIKPDALCILYEFKFGFRYRKRFKTQRT